MSKLLPTRILDEGERMRQSDIMLYGHLYRVVGAEEKKMKRTCWYLVTKINGYKRILTTDILSNKRKEILQKIEESEQKYRLIASDLIKRSYDRCVFSNARRARYMRTKMEELGVC
jgi:hypothetical protein